MAKPTNLYKWSTADGTTLEPDEAQKAAGFANGEKPPARWHNWLFNGFYRWILYLANLHNEVEFLNKVYHWSEGHIFHSGLHMGETQEMGYEDIRSRTVMVPPVGQGDLAVLDQPYRIYLPVPGGATLTRVRMLVQQSAASSQGVTLQVVRQDVRKSSPLGVSNETPIGAASQHSSAAGYEVLDSGPFRESVWNSDAYYVARLSAEGVGRAPIWVEITFEDPGPRNF